MHEIIRKCKTCKIDLDLLEMHSIPVEHPGMPGHFIPSGGVDTYCEKCYKDMTDNSIIKEENNAKTNKVNNPNKKKMGTYSHSKISTFEQCRYQYKLKYIDKIKVDVPTTIEMFMGSKVHETLEKLYGDLKFKKTLSKEELIKYYEEIWDKEYTEAILIVKNYSANNYKEMGKDMIIKYYDHYTPFDSMTILGLETQNYLTLPDGNRYHVRIDKLACKDSDYYVCDYKTNARMKDQDQADSDKQLAMYSIWVKDKFKDAKKVILLWHMLAFDKKVTSQRSEEQMQKLQQEIMDKIKKIESCNDYPTNETALCNYCIYKSQCPKFKHEIEIKEKTVVEFKEDDGVKLVDKYNELYEKKKDVEKELNETKEQLIKFVKQKDIEYVYGSNKKASVNQYTIISLPRKKDREELIKIIKEKGLWDSYTDLDVFKLKSDLRKDKLKDEDVERFVERKVGWKVGLSLRSVTEELRKEAEK